MLVKRCYGICYDPAMRKLFALPDDAVDAPRCGKNMCQLASSFLVCGWLSWQSHHSRLECRLTSSHGGLSPRCFLNDAKAGRPATLGVGEPHPESGLLSVDGLPKLLQALRQGADARAWSDNGSLYHNLGIF